MIDEILVTDKLAEILQDSYGNYVIQTAISECNSKQFEQFNEVLKPLIPLIKNTPFCKKIEAKLSRAPSTKKGDTKNFKKGGGGKGKKNYQK
jgi:hypothetical protein